MGFFDAIGSVLTGGLGGIVGAAGAIAGKIVDLKIKDKELEGLKLTNEFQLALRDKDMAQAKLEAESKLEIQKIDADTQAVTADLASLQSAVAADKAAYGDSWSGRVVDFVRGMVRPVITAWSAALVSYVTWQAFTELHGVPLGPERSMALIQDATFVATLAIAYWFGARPSRAGK